MSKETQNPLELETYAFFDRPADVVLAELAEDIYLPKVHRRDFPHGNAKTIRLATPDGERQYRITLARAYQPDNAIRVWKGKRLNRLRATPPGGVIAFTSRSGVLSFIETHNGENIGLLELEDTATGKRTRNASVVTQTLGLLPEEEGRLTFANDGNLVFTNQ